MCLTSLVASLLTPVFVAGVRRPGHKATSPCKINVFQTLSRFALNHEEIVTRRKLLSIQRSSRLEDGQVGHITPVNRHESLALYLSFSWKLGRRHPQNEG